MKRQTEIVTFGCRLNAYESEVMRGHAEKAGLDNAIVFNTCAVTAEAERQARQAIRKARRENPQARIIVTGCAAQVNPDAFAEMSEVDLVIGNDEKMKAQSWEPALALHANEKVRVNDIMSVTETAGHLVQGLEGRARAFVQVQNGCDHRCTFCIIPYGRGNNRSAGARQIVDAAARLVDGGVAEIVLTGVDITSWGSDLPGRPRLGDLVAMLLAELPGLRRLRLSSIDPAEPDARLMDVLAREDRLMPHLHLSAQHGDDTILKRMKRRHLARDLVRFCDEARHRRPDVVFGADLIAGFPTEDEAAHDATRRMIERAGLTYLHVFPYSPREGTPAARMPQLAGNLVKARADSLRKLGHERLERFLGNAVGSRDQMLVESGNTGHGRNYAKMKLEGDFLEPGTLVDVTVTGHEGAVLTVVAEDRVSGDRA